MRRLVLTSCLALFACTPVEPAPDAGPGDDAGATFDAGLDPDAGADAGLTIDAGYDDGGSIDAGNKAVACASTFGSVFTNAFGRADGTVVAVVPPAWQCPLPNNDHLVIQVSIDGGIQRLVVNVQSTIGDPNIRSRSIVAPLPAPAYEEGWHTGVTLDYPSLGLHSDAGWDALTLEQVSTRIYDAITVGAPLSVYATSTGGSFAASAHLVHRNGSNHDGAIVIDPTAAQSTWLLFHFADQTF